MKKQILLLAIIVLSASFSIYAQDIHFSQFYASPMTLNPSLAGAVDGKYRVAGIYRNQWASVTTPFKTYAASYDMRLLEDRLKGDMLGLGAVLVSDKAGDGNLGLLKIMVAASYHKALGANSKHYLALGIQGGYVQKSLDYDLLTFPNQFTDTDFDINKPNGENFQNDKITYPDFQTGLIWYHNNGDKYGLFNGFSLFHILKPKESFLDTDNRLAHRFVVHGGAKVKVAEKVYLTPNYIFMYQNKARELNLGTAVEYHLNTGDDRVVLSLGGWYRLSDAAIVSTSVEYRKIRAGFSYDFNVSDLKAASNRRGGFEISLIYTGLFPEKDTGPVYFPCPRL